MNDTADLTATGDAADTAAAAAAAVPEESKAGAPKAKAKPEAREPDKTDPLFFSMLLRTQRLLEKDARAAKLSSLSIM